jgi:hypothetical protein
VYHQNVSHAQTIQKNKTDGGVSTSTPALSTVFEKRRPICAVLPKIATFKRDYRKLERLPNRAARNCAINRLQEWPALL